MDTQTGQAILNIKCKLARGTGILCKARKKLSKFEKIVCKIYKFKVAILMFKKRNCFFQFYLKCEKLCIAYILYQAELLFAWTDYKNNFFTKNYLYT